MNNADRQYLNILGDIITNGKRKETRAGAVRSVFGRSMRFNLKDGLPLLTTKKVFYKGIIHELLWFLKGDTNIKYLVDNNVHIWDDDAYRYYKQICSNRQINAVDKDEFLERVRHVVYADEEGKHGYRFGDLGPVYGMQWRRHGSKSVDQIGAIIKTLKENPDDRRMLCCSWDADVLDDVALPPCHVLFQFYTTEISEEERAVMFSGKHKRLPKGVHELDEENIPKRELSCSFTMRSNDFCCGNPYNIAQYAMLTYMLCEVCNMVPGELIYNGNDVHVYENHIEGAVEQLSRQGSKTLPTLRFARKIKDIDDFTYDDFIIEGYHPDGPIKYKLNVGN